jgi:hypothetical protein
MISDQCLPVRERRTGYVTGGVWVPTRGHILTY